MKKLIPIFLLALVASGAFAQSKSFEALYNHFSDKDDVHSFKLGGIFCRAALGIATSDEKMFRAMTRDINHVRFIVIPKDAFRKQDLSVTGFKEVLRRDSFISLATIRDKGDDISIFHRVDDNKKNRYFVLVEEPNEVVAIEMKGYIDPRFLTEEALHADQHH